MSKSKGIKLYTYKDLHRIERVEKSLDMVDDEATSSDADSIKIETYKELYTTNEWTIREGEGITDSEEIFPKEASGEEYRAPHRRRVPNTCK